MEEHDLFKNGSTWIRADFHLHTKADREFVYSGEENSFVREYVAALNNAGIRMGVICNHNKFDKDEFKYLQKKAKKQEICLLPGVELSVNDGANGIHTIIIFSGQWLENGNDYINPFIASMFPGKSPNEYQNENGRGDKNILQLVEELEKTARDYFLIFAHVEQKSGLWKEMNGGKLSDFREKKYATVRKRTLGFQKVRTHDVPDRICRTKVQSLLGGWYPAEVEGSECKSLENVGRGENCWIKLGDFTFEAVKFALLDYRNRLSAKEPQKYSHSHIKKMHFEGGVLGGHTIEFSPELNTMIGIRGSGKSSVL
ncbi:MAG: histidinol-phosphatase, partial [Desulfobacterales bacterium]